MGPEKVDLLIRRLIELGKTISCMESVTSGMIASMITDTEGASAIFPGGLVTYANDSKFMMGVDHFLIEEYGIYSEECARSMAEAVREKFGTDIGIGITGTAGNLDPNNPDSVVGQYYFCIIIEGEAHTFFETMDLGDLSRHETKKAYAYKVFERLSELV